MAKWKITVIDTITKYVDVEADSEEEAVEMAENSPEEDFYGYEYDSPEVVDFEEIV
jgi:hypothetical protein